MNTPNAQPVVLIHQEEHLFARTAAEAARAEGWTSAVFEELEILRGSMETADAVITGLGFLPRHGIGDYAFPAQRIFAKADELDIPVALLSGRPDAAKHIRQDSRDIYVPKLPYEEIAPKLQAWLGELTRTD